VLDLQSHRWAELRHAYGSAADVPALLSALRDLPPSEGEREPWFTLWSALAHQGDVYSASFAAVPHVVAALASAPSKADSTYFQFPAWVEICRVKKEVEIPVDLRAAYFEALARLPSLAAAVTASPWEPSFLAAVLAAIAVAKGQPAIGEAVQELSSPSEAEEFMEWFFNR